LIATFVISLIVYIFSAIFSCKSARNEPDKRLPYACGERIASLSSRIIVSLYRYVIYFIILDSSLLIAAFASLALNPFNTWLFCLYIILLLISSFLLLGGEE
jgi:NADH:ubiquinone oxidoreductase subunit 3 (subunit A)